MPPKSNLKNNWGLGGKGLEMSPRTAKPPMSYLKTHWYCLLSSHKNLKLAFRVVESYYADLRFIILILFI